MLMRATCYRLLLMVAAISMADKKSIGVDVAQRRPFQIGHPLRLVNHFRMPAQVNAPAFQVLRGSQGKIMGSALLIVGFDDFS